jgi:hypothetical protein
MRKMRSKGTGGLRQRGRDNWELKLFLGRDPRTGKAQFRYHTFRGTKSDANKELARLIAAAADGKYVDPSKTTVSEFLERWERDWAVTNVSPKTIERWRDLIATHIRPRIGGLKLQKLKAVNLAELYATC